VVNSDLKDRQVSIGIQGQCSAYYALRAISKCDLRTPSVGDNVIVRHQHAVTGDEEAAP
jgi:hypothetical protein